MGGESVQNLGEKQVTGLDSEGQVMSPIGYQVTDKITRNLLAVSKICETGKAVVFMPAPEYDAFIVHDPSTISVKSGPQTLIYIKSGVYEMKLRELVKTGDLCAGEVEPIPLAQDDPYGPAPEPAEPAAPPAEGQAVHAEEHELFHQCNDVAPIKVLSNPMKPPKSDIEQHFASGHVPFRNWCDICIKARGVEASHFRTNRQSDPETQLPFFSCDYCFPTSKDDPECKITVLVIKEHTRKYFFATVVSLYGLSLIARGSSLAVFWSSTTAGGCLWPPCFLVVNNGLHP